MEVPPPEALQDQPDKSAPSRWHSLIVTGVFLLMGVWSCVDRKRGEAEQRQERRQWHEEIKAMLEERRDAKQ